MRRAVWLYTIITKCIGLLEVDINRTHGARHDVMDPLAADINHTYGASRHWA